MLMNNSLGQNRQTQSAGFVWALHTPANEQLPIGLCREQSPGQPQERRPNLQQAQNVPRAGMRNGAWKATAGAPFTSLESVYVMPRERRRRSFRRVAEEREQMRLASLCLRKGEGKERTLWTTQQHCRAAGFVWSAAMGRTLRFCAGKEPCLLSGAHHMWITEGHTRWVLVAGASRGWGGPFLYPHGPRPRLKSIP